MNKVAVIIVTYNGINWIDRCLSSVVNSEVMCKVIVIDNGSTDGTQDIVRSYSDIYFIQSTENLGFGAANNLGIKWALEHNFDYYFLLNQDAWIETCTLGNLVRIAENNPDFGLISPIHLNGIGNGFDVRFSTYISPSLNHPDYRFFSDLYTNRIKDFYEVNFINAAAWLITKKCIEKVGLFDSLFYHYGEDENYCQRVRFHKFKIVFCPFAKIYHDRDDRELKPDFSEEFIKRRRLIDFANPLIDEKEQYYKFVNLSKFYSRNRLKSLLRFDLSEAKKHGNELKSLRILFNKAKESRYLNKCIK
jgi:GT2 family glycosyltransferase